MRTKDSNGKELPVITESNNSLQLLSFLLAVSVFMDKGFHVSYDANTKRAYIRNRNGFITIITH